MESNYYNCVSEFDLDLFEQSTNSKATPSTQNTVARKHGVARLKDRIKTISQVVIKAKNTNEVLQHIQKELQETKTELEETKKLLFEKNEEHKVICNERNIYFNQASEYAKELQAAKQQLKTYEEKVYNTKLKDSILQGYSKEIQALKAEVDKITEAKKQSDKEVTAARGRGNKGKDIIEKKLVRVLTDYVNPTMKIRDRWLRSLMRKYVPNVCDSSNQDLSEHTIDETFDEVALSPGIEHDNDEKKEQKSSDAASCSEHPKVNEIILDDVDSPPNSTTLNRNMSLDFEYVGSVDTGRGSSLAFSDGDKSSHSPDYYMNDSPLNAVPNLCNKCSITKSDVSTSPIHQEIFEVADSSTTSIITKIDASTNPMPIERIHVGTDTSDISYEKYLPRENTDACTSPETTYSVTSKTDISTSPLSIKTQHVATNTVDIYAVDEKSEASSSLVKSHKIINVPSKKDITTSPMPSEGSDFTMDSDDISFNECNRENSDGKTGDEENNNVTNINQKTATSKDIDEIDELTTATEKETATYDIGISGTESSAIPIKSHNVTSDIECYVSKIQEKECLELNNSKNMGNDVAIDSEVQTILNKMKLRHQLVTPIPRTPFKEKVLSPTSSGDTDIIVSSVQEYLTPNVYKTLVEDVRQAVTKDFEANIFSPYQKTQQQIFSLLNVILNNICSSNINTQEVLSNIVVDDHSRVNTQLPDFNEGSLLSTTEVRTNIVYESEGSASEDNADMSEQNLESEHINQIISKNNEKEELICKKQSQTKSLSSIKKKLTKLEKMRMQMVPKCKIKTEHANPKRRSLKPLPIITKKTVTEADNAASLNDKATYENAVNVLAASKAKQILCDKEPRIVIEDYIVKMRSSPQKNPDNGGNSNQKTLDSLNQSPKDISNIEKNKTTKLLFEFDTVSDESKKSQGNRVVPKLTFNDKSKSVTDKKVSKSYTSETCERALCSDESTSQEIKRGKRKRTSMYDSQSSEEKTGDKLAGNQEIRQQSVHNNDESESIDFQKLLSSSHLCDKLDSETAPAKRKRTSTSCQNPVIISHNNIDLIENNNNKTRCSIKNVESSKTIKTKRDSTSTRKSSESKMDNSVVPVSEITMTNKRRRASQDLDNTLDNNGAKNLSNNVSLGNNNTIAQHKDICQSSSRNQKDEDLFGDTTTPSQRILRSSRDQNIGQMSPNNNIRKAKLNYATPLSAGSNQLSNSSSSKSAFQNNRHQAVDYTDINLFTNDGDCDQEHRNKNQNPIHSYKNKNGLCHMIEKYGVKRIKYFAKKVPECKINEMYNKLDTSIMHIIKLPRDQCQSAMKKLVTDIRSYDVNIFLLALMKFLKDPQRKVDLFSRQKIQGAPSAPAMTKAEQVLLYVIDELQKSYEYKGIVNKVFINIEYVLFALNKTPEDVSVVESMSHFYAVLCRNYQKISKLRLFIVDAMYCLQYKSIVLVKQCLEVWMFVLPLAHLGLANTPLVTCLVYLLHFYKCEDKSKDVEELRYTLRNKYNFDMTDWHESRVLDLFRTAIKEVKENQSEKKMLRLALLIIAKRKGAKWCHENIVKKLLQPIIADKLTSDVAKRFCVSQLGALLKPYPNNMKVHCEMITDYLLSMLDQKHPQQMEEAIVTSLICMNKHSDRLIPFLLKWNPEQLSPEFEAVYKDYIRSKPVNNWKKILSQIES